MRRLSTVLGILAMVVFVANAAFAAQGRGQGGRPAGAGAPQNPGNIQGNRPANPGINKPNSAGNVGNRPETTGKPESAGPKDAGGFKNYGQYVAATHVSEHLNIPLADLKKAMVTNDQSLGSAIKQLRPDLNSQDIQSEVKKAEAAAKKAEAEAKRGKKTTG